MGNLYKHRAIIQSQNMITAKQRKAFNCLMLIAKPQLLKNENSDTFNTTIDELKTMLSTKRVRNEELKQSLEELMDLKLEFNVLESANFKYWEKMVLVSMIRISEDGSVIFEFPSTIRKNIINPEIYGVIDMEVNKVLEGSHSIPIYEFCKDYIKSDVPRLELDVFKKLLGIEGKYKEPRHLKIYVLDPATKEINEKSDIEIRWEFSYTGKKITHINFWSKRKDKIKEPPVEKNESVSIENNSISSLLELCREKTDKAKDFIEKGVEKHGYEMVKRNIEYSNINAKTSYLGFLKKALSEDWAKDEAKNKKNPKVTQLKLLENQENEELRVKTEVNRLYDILSPNELAKYQEDYNKMPDKSKKATPTLEIYIKSVLAMSL